MSLCVYVWERIAMTKEEESVYDALHSTSFQVGDVLVVGTVLVFFPLGLA